jgi:hypothetical protein
MTNKLAHSDGYVRIPTSALPSVRLHHLTSEKDFSIAVRADAHSGPSVTGFTEWSGTWEGMTVSVGWDWGVIQRVIVLLNPNEIRTNIQLIGADDRPVPAARARIHFMDWLETMPWREVAIKELLTDKDLK